MTKTNIGKIKKVSLRELWTREDQDFTKWLEENIDYLNDVIGFDISIESREENVGPFRVDLYGEDNNGNKVIIENQLEKTDHTHLGQIITYLTNLEAKTAIWISSDPIEEHKKAIDWLNETTPDDISFYLIQLEAIKIGDEQIAAPLFTVIKRPSAKIKQIGAEKKEYAQRHIIRKEFWTQFISEINKTNSMCSNLSPVTENWIPIALGMGGVSINLVVSKKLARSEIYINRGTKEENKRIFDYFLAQKDKIESDFGGELVWERMEDNVTSRIKNQLDGVDVSNKEDWEEMNNFLIESAIKMDVAFRKHIPNINRH
jgi:hypothetical protein